MGPCPGRSVKASGLGRPRLPATFHLVPTLVLGTVVSLYVYSDAAYLAAMQEDGVVEWLSFLLFLTAGAAGAFHAAKGRRLFDLLVAFFCLFVAGEEISWGQRLIGYVPPDFFLENNFQQETNLHNFSGLFGRPKWVLAGALAGYGLLLPAVAAAGFFRRTLARVGATPPRLVLVPWFATCVAVLAWYPIEYTGEWAEMLAGGLFLASLAGGQMPVLALASVPVAIGLAWMSAARGASSGEQLACARAESAALARDVVRAAGDRDQLSAAGSVEKRIWSAAGAGYVDWSLLVEFQGLSCSGEDSTRTRARRAYGIDPWGTAYWLRAGDGDGEGTEEATQAGTTITVYSFGPNRRRDLAGGDDVRATERWDPVQRR